MNGKQEPYEKTAGWCNRLLYEHSMPISLMMELVQKVEELERRIDELSRSCEAEEWF